MFICFAEKYAKYWCSLLSDPKGIFSKCHSDVNPENYVAVSSDFIWYAAYVYVHSAVNLIY